MCFGKHSLIFIIMLLYIDEIINEINMFKLNTEFFNLYSCEQICLTLY